MKIQTLAVAAGVSAPLILSGSASGDFVGITTTSKPNAFGLLVVNVYAEFDQPGEDHMIAVAGTPNAPLLIEVIGGTFFQQPAGSDQAPSEFLVSIFPSLAYDSFVTIGIKVLGDGVVDALALTPTWPGFGASTLAISTDGWAITPDNAQGNPFDAVNSYAGNGQVLIGQFSTADGTAIGGTMLLKYVGNGTPVNRIVSFFHVPSPGALAMMGVMGVAGLFGTRRRRRHRRDC